MTPDAVLDSLEAARDALRRAGDDFDAGLDFDLRHVERQVDLAAAAATGQTNADPAARRSALVNLVADLNGLHSRIRRERDQAQASLGRASVNRRAFVAYGDRRPR